MLSEFIFDDPPFKSCHSPTVALTDVGLIMACFGGNFEGHKKTSIWTSARIDNSWTEPLMVANGKQESGRPYACWNPVLYRKENGNILLFYKVGKSPSQWWGMLMSSSDQGVSWSEPTKLQRDVYGPTKNKPIRLMNGNLLCPASDEKYDWWRVYFDIMSDDGWRRIQIPNPRDYGVIQPTILRHSNTTLQALCRSENGCIVQSWSYDDGITWDPLSETELPNPNSGIDAVSLRVDKHLLVYNATTFNRSSLVVALSEDGRKWQDIVTLEDGDGEYSYPSIINSTDGLVHIVYTWNRTNIKYVLLDESDLTIHT